jgi:predicted GNAT family acetyltransferase
MPESLAQAPVVDNPSANRFEVTIGDDIAIAEYIRKGDTIIFTHTEVPNHIQERGVASRMAKFALDQARAEGLKVRPNCPFFARYISKHPEYSDLVAA